MKLKLNMFFFYRIRSCFSRNLYVFYGVCFTDRVALLLLGDVLVDVLVAPVKHELLLLPVVHPHDLFGHLLDDLLQLLQLLSPTKWHFLARQKKEVGFITWPTIWHQQRWADNIFVYFTCKLSHSWSKAWRFPLSPFLIYRKRIDLLRDSQNVILKIQKNTKHY